MWIMMLLSGAVADLLQKILSTTNVRKLAVAVGTSTFVRQQSKRTRGGGFATKTVDLHVCL